MSLCPKKIIVLRRDDDSSGKNIVPSAEVSIKNMAGDLVSIYSDSNGTVSIGNPTDVTANGELEFWIEEGRYYAESAGSEPFYFDVVAPIDGDNDGFTISRLATPFSGNRFYTLNVGRNLGDSYKPEVTVTSVSEDGATTYFAEELAIKKDTITVNTVNISSLSFTLDPDYCGYHIRMTGVGIKTLTIAPDSADPHRVGAYYVITNRAVGDLSVTLGSGVTVVRAGSGNQYSTITLKQGSTLYLTRIAADTYDVEITSDNYGVGTNTSSLGGVSADYSDILGCGFYSVPSGYNTGLGTLPSACPKIRIDQSSNGAAEILFVLPSSAGVNDGKVLGRDRTGAGWNGHFEFITSKNSAAVNLSPVYDEFVSTNGGVTVRLRIWSGENSRDAHALVDVAGTATNGTAGSALPSLSTSFLGSKIYPYVGNILIPFFTTSGGNTVASGYLTIDTSGTVAYSVINGTAYGSPASVYQARYLTT